MDWTRHRGRGAVFNALTQRQRRRLDQSVHPHPHPAKSRLGCGTILIDGLCERPTLLLHWRSGGFCRLPLVGMGLSLDTKNIPLVEESLPTEKWSRVVTSGHVGQNYHSSSTLHFTISRRPEATTDCLHSSQATSNRRCSHTIRVYNIPRNWWHYIGTARAEAFHILHHISSVTHIIID
eukprot:scaffold13326_cov204-Alexandrium_tamarense.AAC.38